MIQKLFRSLRYDVKINSRQRLEKPFCSTSPSSIVTDRGTTSIKSKDTKKIGKFLKIMTQSRFNGIVSLNGQEVGNSISSMNKLTRSPSRKGQLRRSGKKYRLFQDKIQENREALLAHLGILRGLFPTKLKFWNLKSTSDVHSLGQKFCS